MSARNYRFGAFVLDGGERLLLRDGVPVEVSSRYLDALVLLVEAQGRLVSKDRFMDEVWRGVPVTDEALTQCIRTLRRLLGDSATQPRYIETVVKYGYRFVAPVEGVASEANALPTPVHISSNRWHRSLALTGAATAGAVAAGLMGGVVYGFIAAASAGTATGGVSVVIVVMVLTFIVSFLGGAGVAAGVAAAKALAPKRPVWRIAAAALGGLMVGAVAKMIGLDAFNLMFGSSPTAITGAFEGAVIGASVGVGAWLMDKVSFGRGVMIAALSGAVAGAVITLMGGRMMAGSLMLFSQHFPHSQLSLEAVGGMLGEAGFGPRSHVVTGVIEGALFAAGMVAAMMWAVRAAKPVSQQT